MGLYFLFGVRHKVFFSFRKDLIYKSTACLVPHISRYLPIHIIHIRFRATNMNIPLRKGNLDSGLSEFFKDLKIELTPDISSRRNPDVYPYQQFEIDGTVAIFKERGQIYS